MSEKQTYDQLVYESGIEEGLSPLLSSFMVAHVEHETGVYTSHVFEACNNTGGYKYAGQKGAHPCIQSPEGDMYAGYDSVKDSAREIARWIKRREEQFKDVTTIEEYAQVLKDNGYYGDSVSNYSAALRRLWSPIKGTLNTAITKYPEATLLTGVTFFALLTVYVVKVIRRKK